MTSTEKLSVLASMSPVQSVDTDLEEIFEFPDSKQEDEEGEEREQPRIDKKPRGAFISWLWHGLERNAAIGARWSSSDHRVFEVIDPQLLLECAKEAGVSLSKSPGSIRDLLVNNWHFLDVTTSTTTSKKQYRHQNDLFANGRFTDLKKLISKHKLCAYWEPSDKDFPAVLNTKKRQLNQVVPSVTAKKQKKEVQPSQPSPSPILNETATVDAKLHQLRMIRNKYEKEVEQYPKLDFVRRAFEASVEELRKVEEERDEIVAGRRALEIVDELMTNRKLRAMIKEAVMKLDE